MPTENAEALCRSGGNLKTASHRDLPVAALPFDPAPRRSPSACAEKLSKIDHAVSGTSMNSLDLPTVNAMFERRPAYLFFQVTCRRTPTANAERLDRIGGWHREGLGVRRVFRHPRHRSATAPRRLPSARSEISKKSFSKRRPACLRRDIAMHNACTHTCTSICTQFPYAQLSAHPSLRTPAQVCARVDHPCKHTPNTSSPHACLPLMSTRSCMPVVMAIYSYAHI